MHLFFQHVSNNHRITRRADGTMFEGVGELLEGSGIVPKAGRSGLSHLVQQTLIFHELLHKTSLYSGVRVEGKPPYLHAASEYTPTVAKKVETETFFIG